MDHLGINAIHPTAPEYLTAAALFTAPIDVGAAVARIRELWGEDIDPQWVNIDAAQTGGLSGELLTFPTPRRPCDDYACCGAAPDR